MISIVLVYASSIVSHLKLAHNNKQTIECQGYKCKECSMIVHKQCIRLVNDSCTAEGALQISGGWWKSFHPFLRNKSLVWEQLFRSWGGDPEAHGGGEARQDRPNGPYRQLREIQRGSCSSGYSLIIWSGTGGKILFGFNHKDNGKYILIFSETFQVCWYWPEPSWTWCDGLCSEVCPGIVECW